jgi:predicted amidohydrolase
VEPDGTYDFYDKRHLFRMAREQESYTGGTKRIIKEWKGWKICPLICYDLRFPVWSRNVALDYDLLVYVANWPAIRSHVWNTLLQARAIENLSYVVGVNRVGNDGNGIPHTGDSAVIDFKGEVLERKSIEEGILIHMLQREALTTFRDKFPAFLDADEFLLQ